MPFTPTHVVAILPLWPLRRWLPFPALTIGAFTHQIWDAFTHQGHWGTKLVPALNSAVWIGGFSVPGYKIFQYGSTLVGLPLLATLTLSSLRSVIPNNKNAATLSPKWKMLAALVLCVIPLVVGVYATVTQPFSYHALGVTIKLSGAIILLLCIAYSAVFQAVTDSEMMHNT